MPTTFDDSCPSTGNHGNRFGLDCVGYALGSLYQGFGVTESGAAVRLAQQHAAKLPAAAQRETILIPFLAKLPSQIREVGCCHPLSVEWDPNVKTQTCLG
jgi:hypothetical protein